MKAVILLACAGLAWSQSQPQQKDPAGAQAGSSGKTTEQMGSKGSTESPLRKCDSPEPTKTETTKTTKKKKAKKPAATK
jgi:hypothetical protein